MMSEDAILANDHRAHNATAVQTQAASFIWFIWFVLFIWLNQTNQIDQMNQINQMNQMNETDQRTFSAFC